ncbi:MAG TPA: DivIVA domain-containing protein [Bacilli bacterium]|nr:DivIVA domain-containing protein [Bacilli bacterium]
MERFQTEVHGYSKEEVNKFLSDVIREIETNLNRIRSQEKEITSLKDEIIKYHELEGRLNSALEQASSSSAAMRKIAEKEADMIVMEARHNASRIVNDALIRSEKIELQKDTLERNMRIYKKKLRSIVEQQLEVIDEIEILEL